MKVGRFTYQKDGEFGIVGVSRENFIALTSSYPVVYGCICKLKDYETTGLSPDTVEWQHDRLDSMIETLRDKIAYIGRLEELLRQNGIRLPEDDDCPVGGGNKRCNMSL